MISRSQSPAGIYQQKQAALLKVPSSGALGIIQDGEHQKRKRLNHTFVRLASIGVPGKRAPMDASRRKQIE